jgi:hypothetical protein
MEAALTAPEAAGEVEANAERYARVRRGAAMLLRHAHPPLLRTERVRASQALCARKTDAPACGPWCWQR